MGGAVSAGEDNDELIDNLVEAEYIKSNSLESIFRAVDRGDYYLEGCKENAYRDLAWKHGHIHLSAPCIYSEVMESLQLGPGMSFLNLGSGTGYLSTMAGLLLGTYGTNHGVELHEEVVDYARGRLEEFQNSSPALDKYEFCPPSFVVGNCLLLDSSVHQYDRVYCGASCPTEHENYMKNLVRIGGILVMPLNDHLLQVKRTGETSFEAKSVLPVSFASLVLPNTNDTHVSVKLPEMHPLTLQEICRSTIRVLLRKNAEIENPSILTEKRSPKKKTCGRRNLKRIVIPLLQGGVIDDDFPDHSASDLEEPPDDDLQKTEAAPSSNRIAFGDMTSYHDLRTHLSEENTNIVVDFSFNSTREPEETSEENVTETQDMELENNGQKDKGRNTSGNCSKIVIGISETKRSKLPEKNVQAEAQNMEFEILPIQKEKGLNGNGDSGIDNISDESFFEECPSDDAAGSSLCEDKPRHSSYLKRSAEDDSEPDSRTRTEAGSQKYPHSRRSNVIFKRVAFSDADSDEGDEMDSDSGTDYHVAQKKEEKTDLYCYTRLLKLKIDKLPLPQSLKSFLHFSRAV